jgi:hypothetical protein
MKSRFPPLPPSSPPFSINNAYVSGLKDELNIQKNEYACKSLFLGSARLSTETHSRLPSSFRVRVRLAAHPRMPASPETEPHMSSSPSRFFYYIGYALFQVPSLLLVSRGNVARWFLPGVELVVRLDSSFGSCTGLI